MRSAGNPDRAYLIIVAALTAIGLAALSSATGPVGHSKFGNSFWFVQHQIIYGLLPGAVLFFIFLRLPYTRLLTWAKPLFIASLILLALVFVPGLGVSYGKAQSWIFIFGYGFQPSEIAKVAFIIYLAAWLSRKLDERGTLAGTFWYFAGTVGVLAGLLAAEPDIGTLAIVAIIGAAMYGMAGAPLAYLGALVAASVAAVFALVKAAPYRAARLFTFLHPQFDPQGVGYHINQALLAVGSGGFWGVGYGRSRQKFMYLPEVAGDSIFAVIAEEMGFVFTVLFILLFAALVWRGLKIASRAPDRFGLLLAGGISAWFGLQAMINIGSMVGLMPLTGLTLPFVSYGGTSLAFSLAAAAMVANISRRN